MFLFQLGVTDPEQQALITRLQKESVLPLVERDHDLFALEVLGLGVSSSSDEDW